MENPGKKSISAGFSIRIPDYEDITISAILASGNLLQFAIENGDL
jgi:hypothetical protein